MKTLTIKIRLRSQPIGEFMKFIFIFIISLLVSCGAQGSEIPNFHYVDHGIYRSGILTKENLSELQNFGIRSIISMKTNPQEVKEEREYAKANGMAFVHIPIFILYFGDYEKNKFWQVYKAMRTLPKPVLVHCSRGSDRTGIIIAMHRILDDGWSFNKARREMYERGFNPFFSFWESFLKDLKFTKDL